jgi:c-di-AMP phosphodiesterase-like protein
LIKNSTEKKSKTLQRRNQKQYREEIENSTEKKSKTVQRRNQKQYREEIKNNTELCTVFDFFSVLFLISSLYCF